MEFDVKLSGTTANVCMLSPDRVLTCANVGDSRGILIQWYHEGTEKEVWAWKAISKDHKPELPEERSRIEAAGGMVTTYKDAKNRNIGPSRVWLKNGQLPGLAMSRSLGDLVAVKAGTIHKPDIKHFKLKSTDKAIVIASDGVWEFMKNKAVTRLWVESIKKNDAKTACEDIVNTSSKHWKSKESTIDDITVIFAIL